MSSEGTSAMSEENTSALVPRLRFPEFREAGKWGHAPLGRLFSERQEAGFTSLPLLSLMDKEGIVPQEETNRKNNSSADKSKYLRVVSGDIAYNTMRMWEGRSAYVGIEGLISPAYTVCIPAKGINSIFFSYHFKTEALIRQFRKYSQGLVKDTLNLKFDAFSRIEIAYPVEEREQQKVADCLSSLDELITAETQKLDALKTHKKGLLQQLFPREGETLPRLRFAEFREAEEWSEKPLAEVCNVLQGYGFPEVLQGRSEGKYPFCKVSDISRAVAEKGGFLDEATNYVGDDDLLKLRAKPIPKGATVFAKIGEALRLNRRAYVQKECLIDNNTTGLKAIDGVADDYFVYLLSQLIDLNRHCGGAVPSVNKSTLEEIEVVVPGLDEQKRIADSLSSLDDLITAQSQRVEALKTHKKGLMQQLFPVLDEVQG